MPSAFAPLGVVGLFQFWTLGLATIAHGERFNHT
jgi:hypothetical protein